MTKESDGIEDILDQYDACYSQLQGARRDFTRIYGVRGVGIGPKEKNGLINAGDPCLIVYVDQKRPLHELSKFEILPSVYRGIKVDVVELGQRKVPVHNQFDSFWIADPCSNDAVVEKGVSYL